LTGRGGAPHNRRIMRTLFLNPPALTGEIYMKEIGRCGRRSVAGELWPQTGLAYLAAVAEQEGHEARIIDAMAARVGVGALVEDVRQWRPALIVVNTTTPTFKNDAVVIGRLLDCCDALVAFTGTHVSALPEETLATSRADLVVINEAEETVRALLRAMAAKGGSQGARKDLWPLLPEIAGLAWRGDGGTVQHSAPRQPVADIDTLPFPARHLLPNQAYRMPFFSGAPFATVIPTRGCPWPCSFCRAGSVWGKRVRVRSPQNVVAEARQIVSRLGIPNIVFMTDSLTLDRKWAMSLFQAIADDGLKFQWICNSRVDAVDVELLRAMKAAGCLMVSYGIESGDPAILKATRKGITTEQARDAIAMTRRAGLKSMAYFIIGLPGESWETVRRSIAFAKSIDPDYVNFHIATPFPGTELYAQAKEKGWLTTDEWSEYEEEGSAVLVAGELSPAELERAQRMAMRAFYLRPARLARELLSIRRPADLAVRVRAGLKMIRTVFRGAPSSGEK
jgi:anaerobic magnesium-protoporphyrin IX monomethyl ester cyclase